MNRLLCWAMALLLVTAAPALAQTNITGDWDLTVQSPQGTNTVRVTFKQDGDKVSGIFRSQMGELPFEGGSMTGNDLKFAFSIPVQGQSLEITMTGKVEGPSMTGKAEFGGFGEGDWSAKKVDAASATAPAPAPAPSAPATATAPAATASASGISGKWDLVLKTQAGDLQVSADLNESAGKITGTMEGPAGAVDVTGTSDGNAIKLSALARTPQGDIPVTLTGELNGNEIVNGKAEFGGMGTAEWSGKRKQ
jgi:hypothetical protein